eukprot:Blabericola_migrator_1__44@NODE_100_length_14362_cov_139_136341_g85_i1_p1_GENE_NODE_100_length_14362_cov_139_136341_g85_i1NODE_100_length_14362_cov_139_136341_g85_i1_p1_ORF_typecomplete_len638_score127_32SRP68/PF16969_5/1_6e13SRP68/PF16969_5/31Bcl2/PF00452_19/0_24PAXX/PF15384_6/6_2PAXX/PF15384_6/8_5e02PAXX/PF15384_6/1_8e02_NODE_100_length_14362_cov_139_136341_g85_i111293042
MSELPEAPKRIDVGKLKRYSVLTDVIQARASHGVAIRDFKQYRRFQGQRVRKLRREIRELESVIVGPKKKRSKAQPLVVSRKPARKRKPKKVNAQIRRAIPEGFEPTPKFVKLTVSEAERFWAIAARLEQSIREGTYRYTKRLRKFLGRRLYMASQALERCLALCYSGGTLRAIDPQSYIELKIYYCYIRGRYLLLIRKYRHCLSLLTEGRVLCLRVGQSTRQGAVDKIIAFMSDYIKSAEAWYGWTQQAIQDAKAVGIKNGNDFVADLYSSCGQQALSLSPLAVADEMVPQRFMVGSCVCLDIDALELLYRIKGVVTMLEEDKDLAVSLISIRKSDDANPIDTLVYKIEESISSLKEVALVDSSDKTSQLLWLLELNQISLKLVRGLNGVLETLGSGLKDALHFHVGFFPYMKESLKQQSFVDRTIAKIFEPQIYLKLIDDCIQLWSEVSFDKCSFTKDPLLVFQYHPIKTALQNAKALLLALLLACEGEIDKSYVLCNLVAQRVTEIQVPDTSIPHVLDDKQTCLSVPFQSLIQKIGALDQVVCHYSSRFQALFVTALTQPETQRPFPKAPVNFQMPPSRPPFVYPKPFVMDLVSGCVSLHTLTHLPSGRHITRHRPDITKVTVCCKAIHNSPTR